MLLMLLVAYYFVCIFIVDSRILKRKFVDCYLPKEEGKEIERELAIFIKYANFVSTACM